MKKAIMFYFSGTGNTKYAIEKLSENLNQLGWTSTAISIENTTPQDAMDAIEDSEVVILGYPIYGSDLPDIMHDFINELRPVTDKKLGVIATQLLFSGDGSSVEKKKLERLGFQMMWGYQLNMFNNLTVKGAPFKHSKGYEENKKKLIKIDSKLDRIAKRIHAGQKRLGDSTPLHFLLGQFQRPAYRFVAKNIYKSSFSCNESVCVKCQKCVRNCPEKAIILQDEKIVFKNNKSCTACFRCYNFCPASAIQYKGTTKEPLYKGPTKEIYKELFK